ncbi:MAG: Fic family protein [Betaproteobacteria bacterium]|nr:Fic family protein [Betaproteobacteria bacterium]
MAVGAHGYLRSTRGVDLVARLVRENVERMFAVLGDLGYRAAAPLTPEEFADAAWRERRMKENGVPVLAFRSDRHAETPVNVFADEPFAFEEEYVKALVKSLHGAIAVRFVCIETLIRMKEASGRLADRADAEQLRLTLKADELVDLPPGEIDWHLTTWEGSRQKQLRYWATLPLERAVEGLEGMEELFEQFREMREKREFHTAGSGSAPEIKGRGSLEHVAAEAENVLHGLEAGDRTLACAAARDAGAHPPQSDSPERGRKHGLRERTGGPSDAGAGPRPARDAARAVETRFGVLSYADLAPHLARNVLALERRIEDGGFVQAVLTDALLLQFHELICGDLVPQLAGWRKTNVAVSEHAPPDFFRVPALVREYGLDLQARLSATGDHLDDLLLETLAFAEGRLLSIHPFTDFNGRVTRIWLREILRRLDLPPVQLAPAEEFARKEYLVSLQAADRNDWRPLMNVWRQRFEETTT